MKNKFLGILLILGLLSIYPMWRYYNNAKVFADAIMSHVSGLGEWSNGYVNSSIDGKITINNLTFKPFNYSQSFDIESVTITTSPMFLLKTNAVALQYMLPEVLSISVNSASLTHRSEDIYESLGENSMWMMQVGYAGSFGCTRESYTSFDESTWVDILDQDQIYNLDLYYSRQLNGSMDIDLILDAEGLFSSIWSSNLISSYNDDQIIIDELLVKKMYYSYLDYGFNLQRNNACMKNYKSSFAAYRLSSAEHLQKYLRNYYTKELPSVLLNSYQRMLAPDVEYNAIITLNENKYLTDVFGIDQRELYENSLVEVATANNNYIPITLKEIDFTNIDSELLKKENLARKHREELAQQEKLRKSREKKQAKIFRTGGSGSRNVAINRLSSIVGRKVRVKTIMGRPIVGLLKSVENKLIIVETIYKTGRAKLSIDIKEVASVELI